MNSLPPHLPDLKTWQLVFLIVGIVATVSIIINLFIVSRPKKGQLKISSGISTSDNSLIETLEKFSDNNIVRGGDIEILNNGDEFYPALKRDIKEAKQSIEFTVYIWKSGEMSDEIFALLTEKAREGVSVRLLLDGFGAKGVPDEKVEALRNAGGQVEWFHPVRFATITKYHKRNHARAIIIDEKIGYTGGMAVSPYWMGNAQDPKHWRDMMFRLTGAPVNHLRKTFAGLWEIASGEIMVPDKTNTQVSLSGESDTGMRSLSLTSLSPDEDTEQLSTHFATSIAAAKTSIIIVTPYLVLEKRVEQALLDASRRGVSIQILLPGHYIDSKVVQSATQYYYKRLLDGGIQIYEYQGTMIHSKFMVVDNVWSVIGSANIDTRSTFFNVENIIDIQSADFAGKLTEVFEKDLEKSIQITPESWKKREVFRPVFELLASTIDKQL
jgi:cardiolipin synthase